jgi:hypothetical protein
VVGRPLETLLEGRRRLCRAWAPPCGPAALECVPIARVAIRDGGEVTVDPCRVRRLIPSNANLLDGMLLAFTAVAAELDDLEQRLEAQQRWLRYEDGDAQSGGAGQQIDKPIAVLALGGDGQPLEAVEVRFRVMGGAGELGAPDAAPAAAEYTVTTAADGLASAGWKLGPKAGLNTAEAVLDGGPGRIAFHAMGT